VLIMKHNALTRLTWPMPKSRATFVLARFDIGICVGMSSPE